MKNTVSIIIIRDNKYLLQHRDFKSYIADPGTYGAWGGSVEKQDKSIKAAAIRELKEETGLDINETDLIVLGNELKKGRALENIGKKINFNYFAIIIKPNTNFKAQEGQGIVELTIPYIHNSNVNDIALSVINSYETNISVKKTKNTAI